MLFLAGTLCLNWLTVLEVFQNAYHILATRSTAMPGSAGLGYSCDCGYDTVYLSVTVNVGLPDGSKSIRVRQSIFV